MPFVEAQENSLYMYMSTLVVRHFPRLYGEAESCDVRSDQEENQIGNERSENYDAIADTVESIGEKFFHSDLATQDVNDIGWQLAWWGFVDPYDLLLIRWE